MVEPSPVSLMMNPVPAVGLGWAWRGLLRGKSSEVVVPAMIDVAGGVECDGGPCVDAFSGEGVGKKEFTVGVEFGEEDVGSERRKKEGWGDNRDGWSYDSDEASRAIATKHAATYNICVARGIYRDGGDCVGISIAERGCEFARYG